MMRHFLIVATLSAFALHAQQDTSTARAEYGRGRSAMRERKFEDAAKAFEKAIEVNAMSSEYHLWLGHAYTRQLATARRLNVYHGGFAHAKIAEHEKAWERAESEYPRYDDAIAARKRLAK